MPQFIEQVFRICWKPECISAATQRAQARASACAGQTPGYRSPRYSVMGRPSQLCRYPWAHAFHARWPAEFQREYRWAEYDDEALLCLRFKSLGLTLKGSPLWLDVERLYEELERRGLRFRPHVWLSTEWFSPDGIPGFAIPFYLAHPRLRRLERRMMGEVEGGARKWRMRILRHETGHASIMPTGSGGAPISSASSAAPPRLIPTTIRRVPAATVTCCISATGMRRAIRSRTSRRPSPCGCSRRRAGAVTTLAGRPSGSSSMSMP
jgi:hypothetical protein